MRAIPRSIRPMELPRPGEDTARRFDKLARQFVDRGAVRGQMFGMPVLKLDGRVFAGTFGDAMTFKLGAKDLERALAAKGVQPFEPMSGRRMKEWVLVPVEHARSWGRLAEQAFANAP
jgi:hypothetical protein